MKVSSNRLSDIRKYYSGFLSENTEITAADFLVDAVVSHFTNVPRLQLALYGDKRVGESLLLQIHFAIKSIKTGMPLQYALGETEFQGMTFKLNESVLIPRPETEELVGLIVQENKLRKNISVLDVGTGSGCIAISLAKLLEAKASAVDISDKALELARANADLNGVDVQFIQMDILDERVHERLPNNLDLIVSNPPYVRESEKELMQSNVLDYEPDLALFVKDEQALIFYKTIAKMAQKHLAQTGQLWFEINEYLAKETKMLVEQYFDKVIIINDYKGVARFIKASR